MHELPAAPVVHPRTSRGTGTRRRRSPGCSSRSARTRPSSSAGARRETRIALSSRRPTRAPRSSRRRACARASGSASAGSRRSSTCSRRTCATSRRCCRCARRGPVAVLDRGDIPTLSELRLHNGTVYRWNRLVYEVVRGRPHVRVENRVLRPVRRSSTCSPTPPSTTARARAGRARAADLDADVVLGRRGQSPRGRARRAGRPRLLAGCRRRAGDRAAAAAPAPARARGP